MFMNVAYLNNSTSTVVDNTKPLIVTSCGNYRVKNRSEVVTHRPKGRKDYQLLYIASGKGHFFIHGEEKTVSAGNIIIYLPDQPQEYVYYREDQTDVYWVHFTGNEVEEILKYYNINLQNNNQLLYCVRLKIDVIQIWDIDKSFSNQVYQFGEKIHSHLHL